MANPNSKDVVVVDSLALKNRPSSCAIGHKDRYYRWGWCQVVAEDELMKLVDYLSANMGM
jgi:hypothetical protein